MADPIKHLPHDPDKAPIRPDDDARDGRDADRPTPDADEDVRRAEGEAGTGRYVSREKADDELEARYDRKDRRVERDLDEDA